MCSVLGLYCSGWVSTGPVGVILNTMTWGFETGKIILKDIEDGAISSEGKQGNQIIKDKMLSKGQWWIINMLRKTITQTFPVLRYLIPLKKKTLLYSSENNFFFKLLS